MPFLTSIRAKLLGIDPAYADIPASQIPEYQRYFEKVLNAVDLNTQTNWGLSRPFSKEQFRRDEEAMERIIVGEAAPSGLQPGVLQVMVNQYFLADVWQRELDRDRWAHRVIHRKGIDYFPSAFAVMQLLRRGS